MTNNYDEQLRRKKMYISAGKSVMEHNCRHFLRYVNHNLIDKMINEIKSGKTNVKLCLDDKSGAFFDVFCNRLADEIYKDDLVFITLSPFYNSDVICRLFVPGKNCVFDNICHNNTRKTDNLYTHSITETAAYYCSIANEYFELSEKI